MQLDAEVATDRVESDRFVWPVFEDYEKLQAIMVDLMPDFRTQLKVNHKTRKLLFVADIHSVFDVLYRALQKLGKWC